jgi:hypothetical protein
MDSHDRRATEPTEVDRREGRASGPGRWIAAATILCVIGAAVLFFVSAT